MVLGTFMLSVLLTTSCTDLEEEPRDKITSEVLLEDPNLLINLVAPALGQLRGFWSKDNVWGVMEATSDELCFPTRGSDWFDGGVWQEYWKLEWTPQNGDVKKVWNTLSTGIASANFAIGVLGEDENVSDEVKEYRSMLRFLRDYYMYLFIDLYGISPYRDPASTAYDEFPEIFSREKAFYYVVSDMKAILNQMPERGDAAYGIPTRDAGRMLLAKLYLNKEIYTGVSGYDSARIYLDQIINPGNYHLADDYFGIFKPKNDENFLQPGDEAIFTVPLDDADNYNLDNVVIWTNITFHYNQSLSGGYNSNWNGCIAPQGYLEECWFNGTDTATDVRWGDSSVYAELAVVCGFNYGQQYNIAGEEILDRGGNPLSFTFECPLENAAEVQGVRVLKYYPKAVVTVASRVDNDFIVWRYADALLMKAECLARGGDLGGAQSIVNEIRAKRGAPEITSGFELMDILDERGRELYWEGHRRQDMIRFGTYLLPKTNKETTSPETALLLPIPQTAIEPMEGRLIQNPGY